MQLKWREKAIMKLQASAKKTERIDSMTDDTGAVNPQLSTKDVLKSVIAGHEVIIASQDAEIETLKGRLAKKTDRSQYLLRFVWGFFSEFGLLSSDIQEQIDGRENDSCARLLFSAGELCNFRSKADTALELMYSKSQAVFDALSADIVYTASDAISAEFIALKQAEGIRLVTVTEEKRQEIEASLLNTMRISDLDLIMKGIDNLVRPPSPETPSERKARLLRSIGVANG